MNTPPAADETATSEDFIPLSGAAGATVDVPALGGDVQVRAIPLKLLRAQATKGGRLDVNELRVWQLVYGLVDPKFTEAEAAKALSRHSMRVFGPILDRIDQLSGTDEHLRHGGDKLPYSVRKVIEPVAMTMAWLRRPSTCTPPPGRAPRRAESHRAKGSRRRTASSTSSGDPPGDDDPPGESTPPAGRETAERPTKPCPDGFACAGDDVIVKPKRGPWSDGCARCKRARDAARKRKGNAEKRLARSGHLKLVPGSRILPSGYRGPKLRPGVVSGRAESELVTRPTKGPKSRPEHQPLLEDFLKPDGSSLYRDARKLTLAEREWLNRVAPIDGRIALPSEKPIDVPEREAADVLDDDHDHGTVTELEEAA